MAGWRAAILGSVIIAAVSTLGDYVWAHVITRHRPIYGLAHGVILFLVVGACLGAPVDKAATGAVGAAFTGLMAAATWYAIQASIGYWTAMFAVWFGLWLMLSILALRVLQRGGSAGEVAVRSVIAAIGSGLAFYAISGIWRPNNPQSVADYAVHFGAWTLAFLPAFVALLVGRRS